MKLAYGAKVVRYMQRTGIEPRDDEELRQVIEQGFAAELQRVFYAADLAKGNNSGVKIYPTKILLKVGINRRTTIIIIETIG